MSSVGRVAALCAFAGSVAACGSGSSEPVEFDASVREDGGSQTVPDAGRRPRDGGSLARDAGVVERDAGVAARDAGSTPGGADAGSRDGGLDVDAGLPDAATSADAGLPPGCTFVDFSDPAALRAEVDFLASDTLAGRFPGTMGDSLARAYIAEQFRCLGLFAAADDESYEQSFVDSNGATTANVVAILPGSDPLVENEIVVIGAHHDHLGVLGGEILRGANDNASGVVTLIAAAQALQREPQLRRSVAFMAFGSEEFGLNGSTFYVANDLERLPLDDIVYLINLDMVGTYAIQQALNVHGSVAGTPGRAAVDLLAGDYTDFDFVLGMPAPFGISDFQPFCDDGVPYLYFETYDTACWHDVCDEPGRLDYPGLSRLGRLVADVARELANTSTDLTSTRVCPVF